MSDLPEGRSSTSPWIGRADAATEHPLSALGVRRRRGRLRAARRRGRRRRRHGAPVAAGVEAHLRGVRGRARTGPATRQGWSGRPAGLASHSRPWRGPDDAAVAAYLVPPAHRLAHARTDATRRAADLAPSATSSHTRPAWNRWRCSISRTTGSTSGTAPTSPGTAPGRYWRGDPDFGVVEWRLPARAKLAVVGDVGTGTDTAAAVLLAALPLRPDAICTSRRLLPGTAFEFEHRYTGCWSGLRAGGTPGAGLRVPGNPRLHPRHRTWTAWTRPVGAEPASASTPATSSCAARTTAGSSSAWTPLPRPRARDAAGDARGRAVGAARRRPFVPGDVAPLSLLPDGGPPGGRAARDERRWHADKLTRFPAAACCCHTTALLRVQRCGPDPTTMGETALWAQLAALRRRVRPGVGARAQPDVFADGYAGGWPPTDDPSAARWQRALPKGRCSATPLSGRREGEPYPPLTRPLADPRTRWRPTAAGNGGLRL